MMNRHIFDLVLSDASLRRRWILTVDGYQDGAPPLGGQGWTWTEHDVVSRMRFEVVPGVVAAIRQNVIVRMDGTLVVPLMEEMYSFGPGPKEVEKLLRDAGWREVHRVSDMVEEMNPPAGETAAAPASSFRAKDKAYVVAVVHDSGTTTVRDVYLNLEAATHNAALIGGHVSTVPLVTEKGDWPSTVEVLQRTCRVCGDGMRCKSRCDRYCSGTDRHEMDQGHACEQCGAPRNNP